MRSTRFLALAVVVGSFALFPAGSAATIPGDGGGMGGGGTLCHEYTQTVHGGVTHWVFETVAGWYHQVGIEAWDGNTNGAGSYWHLERYNITPPSTVQLAWSGPRIYMHDTQFYVYTYDSYFYWSPDTANDVYSQYRLVVDGTNYVTYRMRTYSNSGRC
jgi:hypothetical protein